MTYDPNNTTLVLEQYLDGTLPVDEMNRVKVLLDADPALREELEAMQLAIEAARHKGLYARVKAIRQEMLENKKPGTPVRIFSIVRYSMRIAAGLLFLAGAFAIYKYATVTNASVYNDLYLQYEPSRTRSVQADPAETAFRQKNWKEVNELAENNPDNKNLFLSGIANLETGNSFAAISRFETVIQKNATSGTDYFNDEAEYYLALAYIRNGEASKGSRVLRTIRQDADHLYRERALLASGFNLKILQWKDK